MIGNPPYGATLSSKEKEIYRKEFEEVQFKINTYSLFVIFAKRILCKKGVSFYIIPNTMLDNYFEEKIRISLLGNKILEINDLSDKVFENAVVHSMIFGFRKAECDTKYNIKVNTSDKLSGDFTYIPAEFFKGTPQHAFAIRSYGKNDFQTKLKDGTIRLFDILDIRQAIKTGNDKEYIVTTPIAGNYKPILRGKDVRRYQILDPHLFVNYGKHLACPRTCSIFEQPKILIREAGAKITATYDDQKFYIMSSLYNAILKDESYSLKYILALINSSLFQYLMNKLTFEKTKGAFTKAKIFHYYDLPVKAISLDQQKRIVTIVDEILHMKAVNPDCNTNLYEQSIDNLVYELYGLSEAEIKMVESGQ